MNIGSRESEFVPESKLRLDVLNKLIASINVEIDALLGQIKDEDDRDKRTNILNAIDDCRSTLDALTKQSQLVARTIQHDRHFSINLVPNSTEEIEQISAEYSHLRKSA